MTIRGCELLFAPPTEASTVPRLSPYSFHNVSIQPVGKLLMSEIIRLPEVIKETGLSRSTIYRMIQEKVFPPQIKLVPNGRSSGWFRDEIEAWKQSRRNRDPWSV